MEMDSTASRLAWQRYFEAVQSECEAVIADLRARVLPAFRNATKASATARGRTTLADAQSLRITSWEFVTASSEFAFRKLKTKR